MVYELARHAPGVLEELLAQATELSELVWAAFEALADVPLLLALPAAARGLLLLEALQRQAQWVIDGLLSLAPAEVLELVAALSEADLQRLRELSEALFFHALEGAWEPGLGVTVAVEGEVDLDPIGAGVRYELCVRHLGGGRFDLSTHLEGSAQGGVDIGEEVGAGEGSGVDVCIELGVEGTADLVYGDVPMSIVADPSFAAQVLLNVQLEAAAQSLGLSLGMVDAMSYLTLLELSGGATLTGGGEGGLEMGEREGEEGGEGTADVLTVAAAAFTSSGGEVTLAVSELERPHRAHIELTGSVEAMQELGVEASYDGVPLLAGPGIEDFASKGSVTLGFDLDTTEMIDPTTWVSGVQVSVAEEADLGMGEVEAGATVDLDRLPTSVSEAIEMLDSLHVGAKLGAGHELAVAWLEQADLLGTLGGGSWALSAELELEAELDGEAVQFVAQLVVQSLEEATGEDQLIDALMAWAMDPLAHTPPGVVDLLAAELAMASTLALTIRGEATAGEALDGGIARGEGEVILDLEKDLLAMGASPTHADLRAVLLGELGGRRDLTLSA